MAVGERRGAGRTVWLVVVILLLATAGFVPARIIYKQNQTVTAKPGEVVIKNFEYEPVTVAVPAGTKLTFTNADGAAHTATADDMSFDSGDLDQGQKFTTTVTKSVGYFCTIHDYMTANIEVSR